MEDKIDKPKFTGRIIDNNLLTGTYGKLFSAKLED